MATQPQQFTHQFTHRGRELRVQVSSAQGLALWYDGVCRKERAASDVEPWYAWTNIELEWEEHHYVEVRYWPSTQRLKITVNRELAYEGPFGNSSNSAGSLS